VHPAQAIRPAMRKADRIKVRNGDMLITLAGKEIKDFRKARIIPRESPFDSNYLLPALFAYV